MRVYSSRHHIGAQDLLGISFSIREALLGCNNCGIDKSEYAIENPDVFKYIFEEAKKQGKSSTSIEKIISQIISLVPI